MIKVRFLPFWEPHLHYASTRLRALFPAEALSRHTASVDAAVGWADDADIYLVVQLASDRMLGRLREVKSRGRKVVLVVCDPHFKDDSKSLAGIKPAQRFHDLSRLADGFCVPTNQMAVALAPFATNRPVHVIPDMMDYPHHSVSAPVSTNRDIVWFGNPSNGNFKSVEPYLRQAIVLDYEVRLITRSDHFSILSPWRNRVIEWDYDTFIDNLRRNAISILGIDSSEKTKSDNRLATSVMSGVPAIATRHYPGAATLIEKKLSYAVLDDVEMLETTLGHLADPDIRGEYLRIMQAHYATVLNEKRIADMYVEMLYKVLKKERQDPISSGRGVGIM